MYQENWSLLLERLLMMVGLYIHAVYKLAVILTVQNDALEMTHNKVIM